MALLEFRVSFFGDGDHGVGEVGEEAALDAQELAVASGASEETSEDVASALVVWQDAVRNHEGDGADVVGDNADGDVVGSQDAKLLAGDFFDALEDGLDGVDVKDGVDALQDAGNALEAHAGVDVFLVEEVVLAVFIPVELGEDVVPELEVAVAVAAGLAVRCAAAVCRAAVEVDFGARAAWAGADFPEVVLLAQADEALFGEFDDVAPDGVGFVVLFIDGAPEEVRVHFEPFGDEFPAPLEGLFFEVLAKGEVAEHFEEGGVACGVANIFNVAGADALLAGGHAHVGRRFCACEVVFQRGHAGVDEQEAFVLLRDQRVAGFDGVAFAFEEVEELLSDFVETEIFHG